MTISPVARYTHATAARARWSVPAADPKGSLEGRDRYPQRIAAAGALRRLVEGCGYRQVEARYWNSLLLPLMVVERKLLARGPGAASDVKPFPPWLDAALFAVTQAERRLPRPLPAGGSVLLTARAP